MRSFIASGLSIVAFVVPSGLALGCPPSVRLSGDRGLIADVAPVLADRGITTWGGECPAVPVQVERRGAMTVVSTPSNGDQPSERAVSDVRTAATVIESWVRTDVEAPLLAPRPAEDAEGPVRAPGGLATLATVATPAVPARGVQVFTVAETSRASDGTGWFGLRMGGCVMLGPLCVSALARVGAVIDRPQRWRGGLERRGVEVLLGTDLPLRLGRATLAPGVAFGVGWTHTHEEGGGADQETGGLRAESHLGLLYPLSPRLAAEVAFAFEVTQATHVESNLAAPVPADPRFFARLSLGVRFQGL